MFPFPPRHTRLSRAFCLSILLTSLLAPLAGAGAQKPARSGQLDTLAPYRRILWITRWDYTSRADVERICYNAASARFTDVLFQVRGEGTVFFKSSVEPWAGELTSGSPDKGIGTNPGWDPLQTAITEGHKYGLRVHAWLNTMPAWNHRNAPPASAKHLYNTHRDWFMKDCNGKPIDSKGFYACLDPGVPAVRDYLGKLAGDLARNYDVDGIHLDYIRYPQAEESGHPYRFHPVAAAEFARMYGNTPEALPEKADDFRRAQVTSVVETIRKATKAARPGIELTAAVIADPKGGRDQAMQEPRVWIERGLVDAVAPMTYVRNDLARFISQTEPYLDPSCKSHLWSGIWPRKENPGYLDQVRAVACRAPGGIAVFCYQDLFPGHKANRWAVELYKTFNGENVAPSKAVRELASALPASDGSSSLADSSPVRKTVVKSASQGGKPSAKTRATATASPSKKTMASARTASSKKSTAIKTRTKK